MITLEQFESGLRLDQYIASIAQNKENFRANFIKAIEAYSSDDILFFRSLKEKVHVAVVTDDDSNDALRDVPLIGRISVEVGRVALRVFRPRTHPELSEAIARVAGIEHANHQSLPIMLLLSPRMEVIGMHVRRLSALDAELRQRHQNWVQTHPEVSDAAEPFERMTPITRTRLTQALFALSGEQRLHWGRQTVNAWRQTIAQAISPDTGELRPRASASASAAAAPDLTEKETASAAEAPETATPGDVQKQPDTD